MLIVVAEDDFDDQFLTKGILVKEFPNAKILLFSNGLELMNYLNELTSDHTRYVPDVIVLDLNMPLLDGFHVLSRIKEEKALSHIPVIVFSTSPEEESKKKALSLGAVVYIVKPNSVEGYEDLIHAITNMDSSKIQHD